MQLISITDETQGTLIGDRIQVADSSFTRLVGLLGRDGVDSGAGLWIKPSSGVHTVFMRFPIDVIGLDKNQRVVKLWHRLVPYRVTGVSMEMRSVVELKAGRIAECGVELGDQLVIREESAV